MTKQEERRRAKYPNTDTFLWWNENPKGKITCDCVVRAIATATGKPWVVVLQDLTNLSIKTGYEQTDKKNTGKYLTSLGWIKQKQPRKADNTKYTGSEFCRHLTNMKRYGLIRSESIVANIGGHHMVCIKYFEGEDAYFVLDHWNSTGGCIGNYWTNGGA